MICEVVYVHGTGELMAWHAEGARVRVAGEGMGLKGSAEGKCRRAL